VERNRFKMKDVTKISGVWHNDVRTFIATKFFTKGKKSQIRVVQKIQTHSI